MKTQLEIIGILLIALAAIHIYFPKYFNWKNDLKPLALINRQMMYVHTFFIGFIVLLIGLLCLIAADDLIHTAFGKKISLGLGIFWLIRLAIQLVGYSPKLWKGKKFETIVHIIFSILWLYFSITFFANYNSK